MGVTICCSTSLTEAPGFDICTVILGISISGINDTGMYVNAKMPTATRAISTMVTAMGRCIKVRSITILFFFTHPYLGVIRQVQIA